MSQNYLIHPEWINLQILARWLSVVLKIELSENANVITIMCHCMLYCVFSFSEGTLFTKCGQPKQHENNNVHRQHDTFLGLKCHFQSFPAKCGCRGL